MASPEPQIVATERDCDKPRMFYGYRRQQPTTPMSYTEPELSMNSYYVMRSAANVEKTEDQQICKGSAQSPVPSESFTILTPATMASPVDVRDAFSGVGILNSGKLWKIFVPTSPTHRYQREKKISIWAWKNLSVSKTGRCRSTWAKAANKICRVEGTFPDIHGKKRTEQRNNEFHIPWFYYVLCSWSVASYTIHHARLIQTRTEPLKIFSKKSIENLNIRGAIFDFVGFIEHKSSFWTQLIGLTVLSANLESAVYKIWLNSSVTAGHYKLLQQWIFVPYIFRRD